MAGPDLDWDVVALRQALADVYAALRVPGEVDLNSVSNLRETVVGAAKDLRNEYEDLLNELGDERDRW